MSLPVIYIIFSYVLTFVLLRYWKFLSFIETNLAGFLFLISPIGLIIVASFSLAFVLGTTVEMVGKFIKNG